MTSAHSRLPCEFQLLRYVSDPVRNEFVHFGVLIRESAARESASAKAPSGTDAPSRFALRFTRDWRRLRCMDPAADTALLESLESDLRQRLEQDTDGKLQRILDESLSLNIQMTAPKAYLAESLPAGLEELMRLYIDPPPRERAPRLSGRAAIQAKMRTEFERAGVWDLLRKRIAASDYTRPGDPLRIDAGYRPNGTIRMFHAVSLEPGVEMAKVLAFSAAGLRAGVERVEKAVLDLAAIIEPAAKLGATDDDPDRLALYRFGVETMEEHRIRVLTTSDLTRVADTARRELRV
ncbi:MAG TPA: DUF3037 domain-containing protein [Terracidiphilus sp.]|nr:DUF3037 domain-containing protein [Terracidiphilus sp.]